MEFSPHADIQLLVGWCSLKKTRGRVQSTYYYLTGAPSGLTLENMTLSFFVVVVVVVATLLHHLNVNLYASGFHLLLFFFNLSISCLQLLDNSTMNMVYVLHFCFRKQHVAFFTGACTLGHVELQKDE